MSTIWVREFIGGLDTRRLPVTTAGGVLIEATNGHITRGGEFEQRASFVALPTLPNGTVGLASTRNGLVVFGSGSTPTLPSGFTYYQMIHPSGLTLTRVRSYDLYGGKIYAVGEFSDGSIYHYYDGVRVPDWFDGRARAQFRVLSGDPSSTLNDITIAAISILSSPVAWATSNEVTASNIAGAINAYVSNPDYSATAVGDTVNIVAAVSGTAANGLMGQTYASSGFVVSPATFTMGGGAADNGSFTPGTFVRTIGSKMYSTSGPNVHFSGIQQPTRWKTDTVGAGFIDMSQQSSGSEQLVAVAKYQSLTAVFAEQVIQIWFFDSDPANNKQSQVLNTTGTASPNSVTQFGDSDIFYLNESGLRSLRARDASNSAATTDIGVPVDTLIVGALRGFTADERSRVIGLIEPQDGRFWLIMLNQIFVFSFFSGAKVSAWSRYTCTDAAGNPFIVDSAVTYQRRVYLRSGNTVYVYGGTGNTPIYDNTQAIARLPYLNGDTPSKKKQLAGIDVACAGEWEVFAGMDPNNLNALDKIGVVAESTFDEGKIMAQGNPTHISLLFKSRQGPLIGGPAKLASALIHYIGDDDAD